MRDPFDFPVNIIPRGLTYQWVAKSLYGDENPQFRQMVDGGWTPVPRARHPDVFAYQNQNGEVEVGHQVLMCRVTESDDRACANAGHSTRRVVLVRDLTIELSAAEITRANEMKVSCYEYARRRVALLSEGRLPDVGLFGLIDPECQPRDGLVFRAARTQRHPWLRWLFNLISTEVDSNKRP